MPLVKVDFTFSGNKEDVPVSGEPNDRIHNTCKKYKLQNKLFGTLDPLLTHSEVLECRAMLGVESLPLGASHAHRGNIGMAGLRCF